MAMAVLPVMFSMMLSRRVVLRSAIMFQGCYKGVARVLQECYKSVLHVIVQRRGVALSREKGAQSRK
jgi:hypothetical protein